MKTQLISLVLLLTTISGKVNLKKSKEKFFVVPYQKMDGSISISFSVEDSLISVAQIDQSLDYTFVTDVFYSTVPETSKPIAHQRKDIHGINLLFRAMNREMTFTPYVKGKFNFILYYSAEKLYSHSMDSIGLAHSYDDYSFSLLHQMKNQKLVNELSYTFVPNKGEYGTGGIYFGGLQKETLSETNFLGKCRVNEKDVSWSCKLKNIEIEGLSLNNKEVSDITFQVFEGRQLVSEKFFFSLTNKILFDFVREKKCVLKSERDRFFFLECYCSILKNFPEMTFDLEGLNFTISLGKLFYKKVSACYSMFQFDSKNKESFTIGGYFLEYFISKFNYFDDSIELYTNLDFISSLKSEQKRKFIIIRKIIIFLSALLFFFTLYLFSKNKLCIQYKLPTLYHIRK